MRWYRGFRRTRALSARAVVALTLTALMALPASSAAADADNPVSLLGETRVSAEGLVAAYEIVGHTPRLTIPLVELAQIFVEEGERYGVRADLAWAQSLVESGWFTYPSYGQVQTGDNNFAGIGAYDGAARGFAYSNARTGVRAQMQLLYQYADKDAWAELGEERLVSAPASKRGIAPTWLEMGNGNWATSTRYSETVLKVYFEMVQLVGVTLVKGPDPVARPGDGLWLAGIDGHVYDVGDARFWGSAGGRVEGAAVVGIGVTRSASGYWLLTATGHVGAYGDAVRWGDVVGRTFAPATALAGDPSGSGYWVLTAAGDVFAFGSAARIEPARERLASGTRYVAIAATPSGDGYWLADDAGNVVAVGDAAFHGDASIPPEGEARIDRGTDPVVDLAARPWGDGYWLITGAGEVLAFGGAEDHGSLADHAEDVTPDGEAVIVRSAVGARTTVSGAGYWIVSPDGALAGLGDAFAYDPPELVGGPVLAVAGRMDAAASSLFVAQP